MAWNLFQDISNSKPLFLAIYGTVLIGIICSSVYVFSALYGGNAFDQITLFSPAYSTTQHSTRVDHASNSEPMTRGEAPSLSALKPQRMKPVWELPPPGSKMPPLKTFRLTKELVSHRVKDNVIIVTFGNYAFMDFILNWVKHLTDFGIHNLLVGAMDTKLLKALYWKGVPVFDMGSHMSTRDVDWGSPTFHKIGREKVFLIDVMLPFGYELLMCDSDAVWLKNPLPYIARYPEADILTSTDQLIPTVIGDRLENWQEVTDAYNIGIFHWRPTDSTKKLAKEWKELLLSDENIWDQNGFNDLLHIQLGPDVEGESGLVYAYDGILKLGLLPASIFCSGHTYFVQAMHQQLRLEPYAVHTTFQYSGTVGKRHRLREAMIFYDQPEYYDSSGGFLSFKPSIPKSLLLDGEHNIESHFSLINYQIKEIRSALAIASLLNRTLVMPPLWCRLDRLWFPHPGVLPGTMTRQPFLCPLDHVDVMLMDLPEVKFGPRIDFREYSFLDNPLLPEQVKESWLDVQLCQEGSQGCHITNETSQPGVLRFPKHSSEELLKTVFSSFKDIKIIQFSSMQDAFQGFADKTREKKFRERVKRYTGIWCCVENHIPGHIYYDMYWDEKPGWKPAPPKTSEDDHQPW
ncbi:arabinosyltransferase XEG113-like isoform X2 [Macadamia integrifolia]|uniref:arabinosyltransferase XEG113-like isoform X2 n=1 Tax=Macadamia integrifolia TaxID=60698 RepID=UPI001C4F2F94|nr:arabinosyltransferase XEG113-like isoform X2 [Macadamia integrifolia]